MPSDDYLTLTGSRSTPNMRFFFLKFVSLLSMTTSRSFDYDYYSAADGLWYDFRTEIATFLLDEAPPYDLVASVASF